MVDQSRGDKPQKRHGAPEPARLIVTVFAAVLPDPAWAALNVTV